MPEPTIEEATVNESTRSDDAGETPAPEDNEPLREQDVTAADRLDDRVSEGEGLPSEDGA